MSRVLLRGARVITMSADRPDWEAVDVLVVDDRIAYVGNHAPLDPHHPTEVVELHGRIVMPGFVNAHLHTWQGALRCLGADWTLLDYLSHMHGSLARRFRPEDMRVAALGSALTQLHCGTTTVGDFCHNCTTPDHADAALEGLERAGIRAVFLHGVSHSTGDAPHDLREVDRLLAGPARAKALLEIGMAVRGPQLSSPQVAVKDIRAANERGLIASMHQSNGPAGEGWAAIQSAGLIGPRTNVVHGVGLSDAWVKSLVDAGATFTTTPENELGQGHGTPITGRLLRLGAAPSLGTDVDSVVSGEILVAARLALAHQRGLDHELHRQAQRMFSPTPTVTSRQALAWATVEGARALGLSERVGKLEPGMQADMIVIDASALNLWPAHDAVAAALQASTSNIEAVMVAGEWRKRDGALLGVNLDEIRQRLSDSAQHLLHEMREPGVLTKLRGRVVRKVVHRRLLHQARKPGQPAPT